MPKYELTPHVDIIAGNSAPMPFAFSEDQIAAREMARSLAADVFCAARVAWDEAKRPIAIKSEQG